MTGFTLALIAAAATAASHVLAKGSLDRQDFSAFLIVRCGTAMLVMAVVVVARGSLPELVSLPPGTAMQLVGVGLLAPLAVNLLYFRALTRIRVNTALPIYQCYPAISFVLGWVVLKQDAHLADGFGVLMVVSGAAGFCYGRQVEAGDRRGSDARAIALLLMGACLMATATVVWKVIGQRASPAVICLFGVTVTTVAVTLANVNRLRRLHWGDASTLVRTALSGALVFAVANQLSLTAMNVYGLTPAVVFSLVSSSVLWIGVLAFLFLREKWSLSQAVAAFTIFAGIVVLGFSR